MHHINNLINLEAVHLLEGVEIRAMERRLRARNRARNDPFQLSNKDFVRLYRVNKRITENVIDIVSEYINVNERTQSALDVTTQVNEITYIIYLLN